LFRQHLASLGSSKWAFPAAQMQACARAGRLKLIWRSKFAQKFIVNQSGANWAIKQAIGGPTLALARNFRRLCLARGNQSD